MILDGIRVLVTGASRGLGRVLALALCTEGAEVIALARDGRALDELKDESRSRGLAGRISTRVADVTSEESVGVALEGVGELDVVINNAGIAQFGSIEGMSVADFEQMLRVNVVGPFIVLKHSLPLLRAGSVVIGIASDAATKGIPTMSAYAASKHALLGLGRSAREELRPRGISVVTLCPGPMPTEILGPEATPPKAMPLDHVADLVVALLRHRDTVALLDPVFLPA